MVLRMHNARPVTRASAPDLYALVQELAQRAQLPLPAIYLIETDQPNAFATGRDPHHSAVAVTRGLMQSLSRDELAGVIAHELAHIKNRDTLTMTIAATIAGAIGFLGQFAFFFGGSRDGERPNPIAAILIMILAPLAAIAGADGDLAHARVLGRPAGGADLRPAALARQRPAADRAGGAAAGSCRRPSTIRPARTCSSSTRCGWAGSTICSAPIRATEDRIRRAAGAGAGRAPAPAPAAPAYATAACRARAGRRGPWA